uniref:THAP-type domain-containing protein n=1 Tax=Heterorhabditis bacteriophora TaxID=37862 RepID=A0A1I7WY41_HETBA
MCLTCCRIRNSYENYSLYGSVNEDDDHHSRFSFDINDHYNLLSPENVMRIWKVNVQSETGLDDFKICPLVLDVNIGGIIIKILYYYN